MKSKQQDYPFQSQDFKTNLLKVPGIKLVYIVTERKQRSLKGEIVSF